MSLNLHTGWIVGGAALVALALTVPATLAFAVTTTPTPSGPSDAAREACKKYAEGSSKWNKCIKRHAANFRDQDKYWAGVVMAKAGGYDDALDMLNGIQAKDDARVLTMIGYSIRKSGRTGEGIAFYHKALALDPNYVEAREYLGEGYLQQGALDKAKDQLVEIALRCGTTCETYAVLAKQISEFEAQASKG